MQWRKFSTGLRKRAPLQEGFHDFQGLQYFCRKWLCIPGISHHCWTKTHNYSLVYTDDHSHEPYTDSRSNQILIFGREAILLKLVWILIGSTINYFIKKTSKHVLFTAVLSNRFQFVAWFHSLGSCCRIAMSLFQNEAFLFDEDVF